MDSLIPQGANRTQILDIVQSVVPVTGSFQAEEFISYVQTIEETHIFPLINVPMYRNIIEYPDSYERVYLQLKSAVVNLALEMFMPISSVTIGANGMTQENSGKSKAADSEHIRAARQQFRKMGNECLERALFLMETDTTVKYDIWKSSPLYTVYSELLIKNTDEFSRCCSVKINRKVFSLLRKPMKLSEFHLKQSVGVALYEEILTNTSPEYEFLREYFVKPIITKYTLSGMIVNISITFGEEDTLAIFDNTSSDLSIKHRTGSIDYLKYFENSLKQQANDLSAEMLNYLNENAILFPDWILVERANVYPKNSGKITRF